MKRSKKGWIFMFVALVFASAFGFHRSLAADEEVRKVSAVVRAGEAFGIIEGAVSVMGEPAEGVKVSTDKNDFITVTDNKGQYTLPVTPNTYTVIAWFHGYKSVSKNDVKIGNRKTRVINFSIDKPLIFDEKTYVGSLRCKLCHSELYFTWKESLHAKSLRSLKDKPGIVRRARRDFKNGLDFATVEGFTALNPAPVLVKEGKKFSVRIGDIVYKVVRTYGGNGFWKQRYLAKIGKSYYTLPIQFNEVTKEWVSYHLENWYDGSNEPLFNNPVTLRDEINKTQSFEAQCAGCHNTNLSVRKNKHGEFVAKYTELNIGCEKCHGPGSRHIVTQRKEDIVNPRNLSFQRRQEVCGSCHSRGKSVFTINSLQFGYPFSANKRPFTPGDDLRDFYIDGGGYWSQVFTDTKISVKHHQQYSDVQQSGHAFVETGCGDCHDVHGGSPGAEHMLRAPNDDNTLCLGCHGPDGPALNTFANNAAIMEHTRHTSTYGIHGARYDPEGTGVGRCSKCHMPKVAKSAIEWDMHDHTFDTITPLVSNQMFIADPAQKIIPNSCEGCHGPKGPGTNWGRGDKRFARAARKYTELFGEPDYGTYGNISGVVSADGAPVEGVRVSTDFEDTATATNDKGEYTLKLPAPGVYTVRAWKDGFVTAIETNVKVSSVATVDLSLQGIGNGEETYVGSSTCKVCHSSMFTRWKGTFHYTTLRNTFFDKGVVADSLNNGVDDFKRGLNMSILPDFSVYGSNAPILGFDEATKTYNVTIGNITYKVERTHGGNGFWKQRYQTNIGNSWYILPIQFNEVTSRWVTYHPEHWYDEGDQPRFTTPDTLETDIIKPNAFERRCAGCHNTGLTEISLDRSDSYVTTHTETYIGCESCHGPGSMHVATKNPEYILNPEELSFEAADEVCGRCHSRGSSVVTLGDRTLGYPRKSLDAEYQPGIDILADLYNLVNPILNPSNFWDTAFTEIPISKSHHQQFIDYRESPKYDFAFHPVKCFECHDPHGSANKHFIAESVVSGGVVMATKTEDNTLCLACHATHGDFADVTREMVADAEAYQEEIGDVVTEHTRHQYNPFGTGESRCSICHMPLVQKSAEKWDIHAHTFETINPEVSKAMFDDNPDQDIIPNSCNQCHVDWAGSTEGYQAGVDGYIERFGD
jgi:predicted CXXCH cytochrome family protein